MPDQLLHYPRIHPNTVNPAYLYTYIETQMQTHTHNHTHTQNTKYKYTASLTFIPIYPSTLKEKTHKYMFINIHTDVTSYTRRCCGTGFVSIYLEMLNCVLVRDLLMLCLGIV